MFHPTSPHKFSNNFPRRMKIFRAPTNAFLVLIRRKEFRVRLNNIKYKNIKAKKNLGIWKLICRKIIFARKIFACCFGGCADSANNNVSRFSLFFPSTRKTLFITFFFGDTKKNFFLSSFNNNYGRNLLRDFLLLLVFSDIHLNKFSWQLSITIRSFNGRERRELRVRLARFCRKCIQNDSITCDKV